VAAQLVASRVVLSSTELVSIISNMFVIPLVKQPFEKYAIVELNCACVQRKSIVHKALSLMLRFILYFI
jgi:hypothetical protein